MGAPAGWSQNGKPQAFLRELFLRMIAEEYPDSVSNLENETPEEWAERLGIAAPWVIEYAGIVCRWMSKRRCSPLDAWLKWAETDRLFENAFGRFDSGRPKLKLVLSWDPTSPDHGQHFPLEAEAGSLNGTEEAICFVDVGGGAACAKKQLMEAVEQYVHTVNLYTEIYEDLQKVAEGSVRKRDLTSPADRVRWLIRHTVGGLSWSEVARLEAERAGLNRVPRSTIAAGARRIAGIIGLPL